MTNVFSEEKHIMRKSYDTGWDFRNRTTTLKCEGNRITPPKSDSTQIQTERERKYDAKRNANDIVANQVDNRAELLEANATNDALHNS